MPRGNIQNLIPFEKGKDLEKRKQAAILGGKASGEARRKKKELAEFFKQWAEGKPSEKNIAALETLGISREEATNKATLIIPLIKNIMSGDLKSIMFAQQLLSEDRKYEEEIKQTKQQTKKLKAETEILKQTQDEGIEIEDSQNLAKMLELEESNDHEEKDKDDSTSNTTN